MTAHPSTESLSHGPTAADPTSVSPRERSELTLRSRLNHLLLTRSGMRRTQQAVPPQLEAAIREIRRALGLEPAGTGPGSNLA
ncbi:hypothetical protein [Gemmata sp.]|uniref:hypothetical protein n=1 Tax=Gemmata sp. TaxID=1914242 RepID=UPI003F71F37F